MKNYLVIGGSSGIGKEISWNLGKSWEKINNNLPNVSSNVGRNK